MAPPPLLTHQRPPSYWFTGGKRTRSPLYRGQFSRRVPYGQSTISWDTQLPAPSGNTAKRRVPTTRAGGATRRIGGIVVCCNCCSGTAVLRPQYYCIQHIQHIQHIQLIQYIQYIQYIQHVEYIGHHWYHPHPNGTGGGCRPSSRDTWPASERSERAYQVRFFTCSPGKYHVLNVQRQARFGDLTGRPRFR